MPTTFAGSNLVSKLLDLGGQEFTGIVRFEKASEKKQLVLALGRLQFSESTCQEEHLVRLAIDMGLFPRAQLPRVVSLMKNGTSSDKALLQTSKLTKEDVDSVAREQALLILGSLFSQTTGLFQTIAGRSPKKKELNLRIPLAEALVLAARMAVSRRLVEIPSMTKATLVPSSSAELMTLPLDEAEAFAYSLIQGATRAETILPILGSKTVLPETLLGTLFLLGLVRLEADGVAPSSSESFSAQLERLIQSYESADPYQILAVPESAGEEQIRESFHNLARQYHPDRFQSGQFSDETREQAGRLFTIITGAYEKIGDPALRARYDEARRGFRKDGAASAEVLFQSAKKALLHGDYEKSLGYLKECVWMDGSVARYHHLLGVALSENPKTRKEAEQSLLRALELDSTDSETYVALGKLYLKLNLRRKAESRLLEALGWDPGNPEATALLLKTKAE